MEVQELVVLGLQAVMFSRVMATCVALVTLVKALRTTVTLVKALRTTVTLVKALRNTVTLVKAVMFFVSVGYICS